MRTTYRPQTRLLLAEMLGFGFSTCAYDPFARRIKPAPPGTANTVFVRDMATMQERVVQAPRFQLVNGEI